MLLTTRCALTYLSSEGLATNHGFTDAFDFVQQCEDAFILLILLQNNPFIGIDEEHAEAFDQILRERITERTIVELPAIKDDFLQLAARYEICADDAPEKQMLLDALTTLIDSSTHKKCTDAVKFLLLFKDDEEWFEELTTHFDRLAERLSKE